MIDAIGVPAWAMAIPPLVAVVAIGLWFVAPHLRRDGNYRGVLIASIAISALEVMVGLLFFVVLFLFSLSGGMQDF